MSEDRSREDQETNKTDTLSGDDSWYEKLLSRIGLKSRDSLRESLEDALLEAETDPEFSPHERTMLKNVVGFHRTRIDDVMVPRANIVAVPLDMELGRLLDIFKEAGHSRLPTYEETLDDPRGMIHIRDFMDYITACSATDEPGKHDISKVDLAKTIREADIQREVLFVPGSMPAVDLLIKMQTMRTHIALVIDEYGGTDGLVSIEDLIETVVGDIEDEHDDETPDIALCDDGSYIVNAHTELEEIAETTGVDLTHELNAEDIDTIGGFIVTLVGRVPVQSEIVSGPHGLEFEILDADMRRIKSIRITKKPVNYSENLSSDNNDPDAVHSGSAGQL